MDGFNPNEKVLVVAATNRIDMVDPAILRAGRFDIKIFIPPPNVDHRKGIFKKILLKKTKDLNVVDEDTADYIAKQSEGWCGADLETLINESIYKAIDDNKEYVGSEHVLAAFEELVAKR
jgi:cell division protease FtsH